jgi:hypothetical protein
MKRRHEYTINVSSDLLSLPFFRAIQPWRALTQLVPGVVSDSLFEHYLAFPIFGDMPCRIVMDHDEIFLLARCERADPFDSAI